jgi:hypothetical protein
MYYQGFWELDLFKFCKFWKHEFLILHMEVVWLYKRKVLCRLCVNLKLKHSYFLEEKETIISVNNLGDPVTPN